MTVEYDKSMAMCSSKGSESLDSTRSATAVPVKMAVDFEAQLPYPQTLWAVQQAPDNVLNIDIRRQYEQVFAAIIAGHPNTPRANNRSSILSDVSFQSVSSG